LAQGQELLYKSTTADGGRSWKTPNEPILRNGLLEAKGK
jgi:hypothetical protein